MTKSDRLFFSALQLLVFGGVILAVAMIFIPMLAEAGAPEWYVLGVPGIALLLMFSSQHKSGGFSPRDGAEK